MNSVYVSSPHDIDSMDLLEERRAEIPVKSYPYEGGRVGAKRGQKDTELHATCKNSLSNSLCCTKNIQSEWVFCIKILTAKVGEIKHERY